MVNRSVLLPVSMQERLYGISAAVRSADGVVPAMCFTLRERRRTSDIMAADVNLDHTVRPEPETALDILRQLKT
jgi:hypothetical protein